MTRDRAGTARLFTAVDPPPRVCERLAEWAHIAVRELGPRRGATSPVRVLDPESLHVTLCFLGERPVSQIDAIARALAECAAPVGELRLGAPVWLPPRRPRALAVEVHGQPDPDDARDGRDARSHRRARGESLAALHDELVGALGRACGYRQDKRRLRPHITLARTRDGNGPSGPSHARGRARTRASELELERSLPPTPALSFTPDALVLYRSWLSARGASYEALARFTLVPDHDPNKCSVRTRL